MLGLAAVGVGHAAAGERTLPFRFDPVCSRIGANQVRILQLDDEPASEIVNATPTHLLVSRLREGGLLCLVDQYLEPGHPSRLDVIRVYGSPRAMLALSSIENGRSVSRVLDLGADAVRWITLESVAEQCWPERGGGVTALPALMPFAFVPVTDGLVPLPSPDQAILLAALDTAFFDAPRGVVAFGWPSGRIIWSRRFGPRGWDSPELADADHDGLPEIFVGTFGCRNGRTADGTSDMDSWVFAYTLDGRELWRKRTAGGFWSTHVMPADLGDDGRMDVLLAIACGDGLDPRQGCIRVLDALTGEERGPDGIDGNYQSIRREPGFPDHEGFALLATRTSGIIDVFDGSLRRRGSIDGGDERYTIAGVIDLERHPGSHSMRGLVLNSSQSSTVLDAGLRPVARLPHTPPTGATFVHSDSAGRPAIAVLDGTGFAVYAIRATQWPERAAGWILDHPILSFASWTLLAGGVLGWGFIRTRRRRRALIAFDRALGTFACFWGHRGAGMCALRDLARDLAAVSGPPGAAYDGAVTRLPEHATAWTDLIRPQLEEYAGLLREYSIPPGRIDHAAGRIDRIMTKLRADPLEPGALERCAREAREPLLELIERILECQARLAPRITCDPVLEWKRAVSARAGSLAAAGVQAEPAPGEGEYRVLIAPLDLRRIFANLIQNSCEAMNGAGERWIRLEPASVDFRFVTLDVVDSGPGMGPEQLDEFRAERGGGAGLRQARSFLSHYTGQLEFPPARPGDGARIRIVLQDEGDVLGTTRRARRWTR